MHPFWNFVVQLVPRNVAPNVLTLLGLACTTACSVLLAYYDPNLDVALLSTRSNGGDAIPLRIWLTVAILHFLAHTLDGIDGKQARRTGSSSPLGELCDHGVDSMTTSLLIITLATPLGAIRLRPALSFACSLGVLWTFYLPHWEKYNTGVLFLPWTYDAMQLSLLGIFLLTAARGVAYWQMPITLAFPWGAAPVTFAPLDVIFGILVLSPIGQLVASVANVLRTPRSARRYALRTALMPLVPMAGLTLGFSFWVAFSPSNIWQSHPRLLILCIGFVFSNAAVRGAARARGCDAAVPRLRGPTLQRSADRRHRNITRALLLRLPPNDRIPLPSFTLLLLNAIPHTIVLWTAAVHAHCGADDAPGGPGAADGTAVTSRCSRGRLWLRCKRGSPARRLHRRRCRLAHALCDSHRTRNQRWTRHPGADRYALRGRT